MKLLDEGTGVLAWRRARDQFNRGTLPRFEDDFAGDMRRQAMPGRECELQFLGYERYQPLRDGHGQLLALDHRGLDRLELAKTVQCRLQDRVREDCSLVANQCGDRGCIAGIDNRCRKGGADAWPSRNGYLLGAIAIRQNEDQVIVREDGGMLENRHGNRYVVACKLEGDVMGKVPRGLHRLGNRAAHTEFGVRCQRTHDIKRELQLLRGQPRAVDIDAHLAKNAGALLRSRVL